MNNLMTIKELAVETRTPEATYRYWRHCGDRGPRSFKIGRRVMYRREDVEKWLAAQYDAGVGA